MRSPFRWRTFSPSSRDVQAEFPVAPADLSFAQLRRWLSAHPLGFDGIYSFLDVFTGRKKSVAEYASLRVGPAPRLYRSGERQPGAVAFSAQTGTRGRRDRTGADLSIRPASLPA